MFYSSERAFLSFFEDQGACEDLTKAPGTDEIAKKSPAATGRGRFVSGRRPRFCIGSILQKWIPKFQNFKTQILKNTNDPRTPFLDYGQRHN